jgi:rhodanese-related sulfurtransferase
VSVVATVARTAAAEAAATDLSPESIFARAARRGAEAHLDYAGAVTPPEAWVLVQQQAATLVDVRTPPECKFVGRVPGTSNVEWQGAAGPARQAFVQQLRAVARAEAPLLLLCRSGVRSHAAALAATEAGFREVYNILEGFEGQIDDHQQRGRVNGWRFHALPWVQD